MGMKKKKSQGFAVIFVLVFIATIITILADILYQTQVVAKHTMSEENQIKAQGTALTGLSFAKLLIKFHALTQSKEAEKFPFNLPSSLYTSLNNIPIGKNFVASNPLLKQFLDPTIIAALQKIPGEFILNITSENCKLDLNLLQPGPFSISTNMALRNLFTTPNSQSLLEIYNLNAESLVQNLLEYIRTVNRPFVTLDEIRMVEGFQYDDIYNIYAPYLTIWPTLNGADKAPLNPNCAPIELLASILRPNPNDVINPVLWQKFHEYRKDNTFKNAADFNKWFEANAKTWLNNDVKSAISRYFGYKEDIFKIEITAIVSKIKQKLVVVLRLDDNGKIETLYNQWSS